MDQLLCHEVLIQGRKIASHSVNNDIPASDLVLFLMQQQCRVVAGIFQVVQADKAG